MHQSYLTTARHLQGQAGDSGGKNTEEQSFEQP